MSMFKSIIDKLTSINFWTIVGSLIAVVTAGVTLYQHKSTIEVEPRFFSGSLHDEEKVLFVLLNYYKTNSDSISFELPIHFYNPSKKAIELEYTINPVGHSYFAVSNIEKPAWRKITILREEAALALLHFKASRKEIDEKVHIEGDLHLLWTYENMSDRNKALLHYVVVPLNASTANYVAQKDITVLLNNDGTESGHFSIVTEEQIKPYSPSREKSYNKRRTGL